MFEHQLVTSEKIKRINIEGKRYYILPDGVTKLKSVTTIIAENTDNSAIIKWRKRVGNVEANRVSKLATSRGTSLHKITEKFLLNEADIYNKAMPTTIESFKPLKKNLENHVSIVRGIELNLYSRSLGAAGSADLIADYDGITSIIDHKTSSRRKKEEWIENYFIQATAYGLMFWRMYNIPVPQIVIQITVDGESEPQVFVKNIKQYIPRVLEIFKNERC